MRIASSAQCRHAGVSTPATHSVARGKAHTGIKLSAAADKYEICDSSHRHTMHINILLEATTYREGVL